MCMENEEKKNAYKVLEHYNGDMIEDSVLVNYILNNPKDKTFQANLKKKAPNVYLFLERFWDRKETMEM